MIIKESNWEYDLKKSERITIQNTKPIYRAPLYLKCSSNTRRTEIRQAVADNQNIAAVCKGGIGLLSDVSPR